MASKKTAKKITFITAIISLISFIYKVALAYLSESLVLFIASISTLMVFVCKVLFVKNLTKSRAEKKKAFFIMILSLLIYSFIFIAFSVLKICGIDITNEKSLEGLYGILFISFLVIMFILSLLGFKSSVEKSDIIVTGLKGMTLAGALTDLVIIEKYVTMMIYEYKEISILQKIDGYFPLGVAILMVILCLGMIKKFICYKVKE